MTSVKKRSISSRKRNRSSAAMRRHIAESFHYSPVVFDLIVIVISVTARTLPSPGEFDNARGKDKETGRQGEWEIKNKNLLVSPSPCLLVSLSPFLLFT